MALLLLTMLPTWTEAVSWSGWRHALPVPEHGITSAATAGGWIYSILTDDPAKQQAAWGM